MSGIHILIMVTCCALWGGNVIVNKLAIQELSPVALALLRFSFALPFLVRCQAPRIPYLNIALVSMAMAAQWITMNLALYYGLSASICGLVVNTGTTFACLFCYSFFNQKPTFGNKVGIGISLLGLLVITRDFNKGLTLIGFLYAIGAAISFSLVTVLTKWSLNKSNDRWPFTVYTSSLTFFILLPLFFITDGISAFNLTLKQFAYVSYSGIFSNLLGMYAMAYLVARYEPYKVMQFSTLVPIFGFIGGALFLGEKITEDMLLAFAFIIVGLLISNKS